MKHLATNWHDIKKYFNYFFEKKGFVPPERIAPPSDAALLAAADARGADRPPSIFIHGIMPRSGTVYVGELLRRHPDIYAFPHELWEIPALQLTGEIIGLQERFLQAYKPNRGRLSETDFLVLFGSALLAYLHQPIPSNKRLLAKMPNVQYLPYFFSMFPNENLLILVRDGRDLVHSTLRTWRHLNFIQVCLRWNRSARVILDTCRHWTAQQKKGFSLVRYEKALHQPEAFVREACSQLGLDERQYPYDQIEDVRVIGSSKLEAEKTVSWRHLKRPKQFRPVEYWKEWPPIKKGVFKLIAGRSLIELGYAEDGKW